MKLFILALTASAATASAAGVAAGDVSVKPCSSTDPTQKWSSATLSSTAALAGYYVGDPTPYKVMPGYMPKDNTDPKSVKTNSSLTLADCEQVSEHSPTSHQPTAHRPPPSGLADG